MTIETEIARTIELEQRWFSARFVIDRANRMTRQEAERLSDAWLAAGEKTVVAMSAARQVARLDGCEEGLDALEAAMAPRSITRVGLLRPIKYFRFGLGKYEWAWDAVHAAAVGALLSDVLGPKWANDLTAPWREAIGPKKDGIAS